MDHQTPEEKPKTAEIIGQLELSRFECWKQRCDDPNRTVCVRCCSFHPSRPTLACGLDRGHVRLFDGTSHATMFGHWNKNRILKAESKSCVLCIDWNISGCKLAAGLKDGTVVVWLEDGKKSFELKGHSDWITSIMWNEVKEKSHLFVTGSWDETAIVWDSDAQTALQIFHFHSDGIDEVTWMSADVFASCSDDKTIKICQLGRSDPLKSFDHQRIVNSLSWNAEDGRLASCSEDGSIMIWSIDRQEPVVTLRGGRSSIDSLDWHRRVEAGTTRWCIVGGCRNGDVLVWDLQVDGAATSPRILPRHKCEVWSVAFSPDGRFLASADWDGTVLVWCTKKWQALYQLNSKCTIRWKGLRWNCEGTKLAIPNFSPEVYVIELDEFTVDNSNII